jgi:hypothetical protein
VIRPGLLLAACLAAATPAPAPAQADKLDGRLDSAVRDQVQMVVDSARAAGLPAEPLVDKALEGAAKRADGKRILAAVRSLAASLHSARSALGPAAPEPDLIAGAEALRAGVHQETLAELRTSRGEDESLLAPLAVMTDLIARGVPADTAAAVVLHLAHQGATDADFGTMQHDVERDIGAGAPPASAASVRGRGHDGPAVSDGASAKAPRGGGARQGPPGQRPPKERPAGDKSPKEKALNAHSQPGPKP